MIPTKIEDIYANLTIVMPLRKSIYSVVNAFGGYDVHMTLEQDASVEGNRIQRNHFKC